MSDNYDEPAPEDDSDGHFPLEPIERIIYVIRGSRVLSDRRRSKKDLGDS